MTEAVIPARRVRRRKPMPPWLKWYIMWCLVDVALLFSAVWNLARGEDVLRQSIAMSIATALLLYDYPRMRREWDAWRRDDR